jgi:ribosomal protein S18 acetylase RimI-like enzyme
MSHEAFAIRHLIPEDASRLKTFRLLALTDGMDAFHSSPDEWDKPVEAFATFIATEQVFGAFDEADNLVGMAVLALSGRARRKTRHKAEIWSVFVVREARRLGLARRLVEACIGQARELALEALVLTVTARNAEVVRFYESIGFRIFGTEPRMVKLPDGSYLDDHYMQLDLTCPS